MRASFALLALGAGCGSKDADVLQSLAGSWAGTVTTDTVAIPATATFEWDDGAELLSGTVTLQDPPPEVPHTYAVRRWEVIRGQPWLDLTDVEDGTRALQLDEGTVEGSYAGSAVVRYPCPGQSEPCGYTGTFTLAPAPGGGSGPPITTPPPGGSGRR